MPRKKNAKQNETLPLIPDTALPPHQGGTGGAGRAA